MKLLNPDYSYNTTHFKGVQGTYKLIGIESNGRYPKDCLDTFKCLETGEYRTIARYKIYNLEKEGKIKGYNPNIK